MDNGYFTSTSFVSASLPASGMNAKLTYDSTTHLYSFKKGLVIAVSILAVILLFPPMVSERMIGV